MPTGVFALNTHPRKSLKKSAGEVNIPINFGGVTFAPNHFLYADADGIVVSEKVLA